MPLRGNVPTRIRRLREGKFDAIILAKAGLKRLDIDLSGFYSMALPFSYFLPSPGQGALAIQVRSDDKTAIEAVKHLHDAATAKSVQAERQFLKAFGAGCSCAYWERLHIALMNLLYSPGVNSFR